MPHQACQLLRCRRMYDIATYFSWFVLALLSLIVVIAIVWLGSQPKKIAMRRNHPQVDAINACSWIGLALGGIGWPIAFIWAFWNTPGVDPNQAAQGSPDELARLADENRRLQQRVEKLESELSAIQSNGANP